MFRASTAFLPSSFAMYTTMLGMAAFINWRGGLKTAQGIFWFAVGGILGWPFSVALAAPFLLEELIFAAMGSREALPKAAMRFIRGIAASLFVLVCCSDTLMSGVPIDVTSSLNSLSHHTSTRKKNLYPLTSSSTMSSVAKAEGQISMGRSRGISISEIFSSTSTFGLFWRLPLFHSLVYRKYFQEAGSHHKLVFGQSFLCLRSTYGLPFSASSRIRKSASCIQRIPLWY